MRPFSAIVAILGIVLVAESYGCSRADREATAAHAVTTNREITHSTAHLGNVELGHRVFTNNCATCHGETGREGGVGPSLRDERARKNDDATIAWIKHPVPPMPTLYPSPLSEDEVENVAAYVQSL